MMTKSILPGIVIALGLSALCVRAGESTASKADIQKKPALVCDVYLGLASGIRTIPVQFFFDKNGKEVFRHVGFWPQTEIEKKLAEIGVQ